MFKNYLKIAFRNLHRHRFYSLVNIFGLAIGVASCLLITLFIRDEWSYDKFHKDADRIYRIALQEHYKDREILNVATPFPFAGIFASNLPEVEEAVRVVGVRDRIRRGDKTQIERIFMADPGFFEMFDFPLNRGEADQVLNDVHKIVLSEDAAAKWFGSAEAIGQTLSLNIGGDFIDHIVSGVAANPPANSSIRFDYLVPIENAKLRWDEKELSNLYNVFVETYIRLPGGYDVGALEAKMPALIQKVQGEDYVAGKYMPRFQRLTDIHLNTDFPEGEQPISDPSYSYILATIALFVLLIGCINFMTLTLSRSAERVREVGVRKTLGAFRGQIAGQFWGETLWLSLFGSLLGFSIASLVLPLFNHLAGKELTLELDGILALSVFSLTLLTGLLAGSYPSIFLSRHRPVEIFKGKLGLGQANNLRRLLTVVQLALAILLIISTLVMRDQLRFLQQKNLGYDKEQLVSLPTGLRPSEGMPVFERLRNEIAGHSEIAGVTAAVFTFGEPWIAAGYRGKDGVFRQFRLNLVDFDYLKIMNIPVVAGRDFSREAGSDRKEAVIVNRAFAELHGWSDPIGRQLPGSGFPAHQIIGMVDDFNYASLHSEVEPLALALGPDPLYAGLNDLAYFAAPQTKLLVRLKAGKVAQGLQIIKDAWESVTPGLPFNYVFVDDTIQQQYVQEQRLGTIVEDATVLVVAIACLGLFSLASLTVVKRTKEIGVRKVLGASVGNIVILLTGDFVLLIGFAFALAVPVGYFVLAYWLQGFAYATTLKPATFALAGLITVGVALAAVSHHCIRTARSNPAEALRYE